MPRCNRFLFPILVLFLSLAPPAMAERWAFDSENNESYLGDKAVVFYSQQRDLWLIQFAVHKSVAFTNPKIGFLQSDGSWISYDIDAKVLGNKYLPSRNHSISQFPLSPKIMELLMSSQKVVYSIGDHNYHVALDGSRAALTDMVDNLQYFLAAEDDKQHAIAQAKSDAEQARTRAIQAVAICDNAAGDPWDQHVVGTGLDWDELDGAHGVAACEHALSQSALTDADRPRITYQLGRALDKIGDPRSLDHIKQASLKLNYAAAIYHLALFFEDGLYAAKDPVQAKAAMRAAASRGYIPAKFRVGQEMFKTATTDAEKYDAEDLLKEAADAEYLPALVYWGNLVVDGKTSMTTTILGRLTLQKASKAGSSVASLKLYELFLTGKTTVANPIKAESYLKLAAQQGNKEARSILGE